MSQAEKKEKAEQAKEVNTDLVRFGENNQISKKTRVRDWWFLICGGKERKQMCCRWFRTSSVCPIR